MGSVPDAARGHVARSTFPTVFLTALWIFVAGLTQLVRAARFGAGRLWSPAKVELRLWNDLDD